MVGQQLRDLLMLAGDGGGGPGIVVKRRRTHLRIEFVGAALEKGDVGKGLHGS